MFFRTSIEFIKSPDHFKDIYKVKTEAPDKF